jgi:Zn finger protein HypA/HybF involved in hydrogenase expression
MKIKSKEHLENVVKESASVSEVQRKLGYKPSGGIHKFLKGKFKEFEIDTSHFTGQGWSLGKSRETDEIVDIVSRKIESPWEHVFRKGNHKTQNETLIRRLIRSGKREYKCEDCGVKKWGDKPLRLQLDHINGDNSDCQEINLKIICPNCHSQTETFSRGMRESRSYYRNKWWKQLSMN